SRPHNKPARRRAEGDPMLTRVLMLTLALLGFVLFPALAFAQDAAPSGGELFLTWLPAIVTTAVAIAGALGLWALVRGKLGELFDFLAVKTKMSFLAHVDEVLVGAAGQAYDEGAAWLQAALADGKVQPDEWRDLLERSKRIG